MTSRDGPRPALLIDVDGPLNPYRARLTLRPDGYETHRYSMPQQRKPLRVWLNPSHGPALLALADRFELWWATTWEQQANEWVAPRVGLPTDLPVVRFGKNPPRPLAWLDPGRGIYFKTEPIAAAMTGRYFVWIDDDVTTADSDYLARRHPAGSLIYRIDPAVGLLPGDFAVIAELAADNRTGLLNGPTVAELMAARKAAAIQALCGD